MITREFVHKFRFIHADASIAQKKEKLTTPRGVLAFPARDRIFLPRLRRRGIDYRRQSRRLAVHSRFDGQRE